MPRFYAWNKKQDIIVGWLGYSGSKQRMKKRLESYEAPSFVEVKKFTKKQLRRQMTKQRNTVGVV